MADISPEAGPAIITSVIDSFQSTRRLRGLHEARFGEAPDATPMEEALGHLGLGNLARLATGEPLRDGEGVRERAAILDSWAQEEKHRSLGERAFTMFIAQQDGAIAEMLRGLRLTITRLDGAAPRALVTHPHDGFEAVDGPVSMVFRDVRSQDGRLGLGLRPTDATATNLSPSSLQPEVYAYVLGPAGEPQLDLTIDGRGGGK